jgi:hypothetical protein
MFTQIRLPSHLDTRLESRILHLLLDLADLLPQLPTVTARAAPTATVATETATTSTTPIAKPTTASTRQFFTRVKTALRVRVLREAYTLCLSTLTAQPHNNQDVSVNNRR